MSGPPAADPGTDAARAAEAAGVEVRLLTEMHETRQAEALMMRVWDSDRASVPLTAAAMRALAHSGNPVTGAFRREEPDVLVGCTAGFCAPPAQRSLHSHVAAVDTALAGRGAGTAMKLHQRAWALDHGVHAMTWTFDPLVARNAFFNLGKLGAAAASYLEDHYGPMTDGLNAGSPTDRLLVRWDLRAPLPTRPTAGVPTGAVALTADDAGAPVRRDVPADAAVVLVGVPRDVERLRRDDPAVAAEWRLALRAALQPYVTSPAWRVTTFDRTGTYVVERSA